MPRKNFRQAKLARKAGKEAKKERRQRQRRRESFPSFSLLTGLNEAEEFLKEGNLEDAVEVLEELQRRHPRRVDVLVLLLEAYLGQQDIWSYQAVCQRLVELDPDEADTWLALAGAAILNGQLATAHRAFGHILSHWPNNPHAAEAREAWDGLDEYLRAERANQGLAEDEGIELLCWHDEIGFHLHRGEYDRVCGVAERLLARCPTFAPALNNRSEAHFRSGRLDLAIADARRVLEFDAGNFHALGNLTRYLFLDGQFDDANVVAQRLKAAESDSPDCCVKQAEALIFLGDWSAVLDALRRAESRRDFAAADGGLLYYLAGVAAANLGDLDAARKYWKRAIKLGSVVAWAEQNLDDLKRPVGEQNGPWAFPIDYWVPRPVLERLVVEVGRAGPKARDPEVRRRVRKFFQQHPNLEQLAPRLLAHGERAAKEFVVRVASLAGIPSIQSVLKDFALGRRGTDQLRFTAATKLIDAKVLVPGPHWMWRDGELRELNLTCHEISPEPLYPLPKNVQPIAIKAHQAIANEDGAAAEALLDQALRLRPDDPSLLYNRAVAIGLQGRKEEAMALVRDLHARYPDYLFARTRLAEEAVARRDYGAAQALLDPLISRSRFHLSEYAALCHAHIELLAAEGKKEGARSWLKMWQEVSPDDPRAEYWEARLNRRGLIHKLFGRGAPGVEADES